MKELSISIASYFHFYTIELIDKLIYTEFAQSEDTDLLDARRCGDKLALFAEAAEVVLVIDEEKCHV